MPRTRKIPLTFAEKMQRSQDKYGYYDPDEQGFGTPQMLREIFNQVMGEEVAQKILGQDAPIGILGFDAMPTFDELKTRFRKLSLEEFPDKVKAAREKKGEKVTPQEWAALNDRFRKLLAAYSQLKRVLEPS
jgi:hypothetical protein